MSKRTTSKDKVTDSSERRTLIKKILGGAGVFAGSQALPDNWIKPAISTALIPAHGNISDCVVNTTFFVAEGQVSSEAINVSLEFSTTGVPEGASVFVAYTSENGLQMPNEGNSYVGTINSDGIPIWNTGPVTTIEVQGNPIGAEVFAEIDIEGCPDLVELNTEA